MEWKNESYEIVVCQHGKNFTETVEGVVCPPFGIHENDIGWAITHLKSGWAVFIASSAYGAKEISEYLIENYREHFEKLVVSGNRLENFKPLVHIVVFDKKLARLRSVLCVNKSELKRKKLPKPEVVS